MSGSSAFEYKINGQKSYIITYTPTNSTLNYSYTTIIPNKDILGTFSKTLFAIIALVCIALLIITYLIYFSANQIYIPINKLTTLVTNDLDCADDVSEADDDFWGGIYSSIQNIMNTKMLDAKQENQLQNNLLTGNIEEAKSQISEIINLYTDASISATDMKQLYSQIFIVVFKIIKIKSIEYDFKNQGDIEIISEILALTKKEIDDTLNEYIDENYMNDIYLDSIADKFNIPPKQLSKQIKDTLGLTFLNYLSSIARAKYLLEETDMSITDIQESLSFEYRSTFIRTFKKNTGLSPSEYRKNFKHR